MLFVAEKTEDGLKGNSLAAWELVCRPKLKGGLGIINLKVQNQGLLLKQLHKFYNKAQVPWVQLIWSTYYADRIPHASDPCGSFWWRDLLQLSDIYRGVTSVKVNAGDTVLFWKDMWCNDLISITHPRAFSFSRDEDMSVRTLLSGQTLSQIFHLPLSVEAREEVHDLQQVTSHLNPGTIDKDSWCCIWGGSEFRTSKYYSHCFSEMQVDVAFTWIWKTKCTM